MKVILLEDEVKWQEQLLVMLNEIGLEEVKVFNNIFEIQTYLEGNIPDILIADVVLETNSVFDIAPIIKKYKIPSIFISAYPKIENFEKSMAMDNVRFIVKPFHSFTLNSTIQSLKAFSNKRKDTKGIEVTGKLKKKILVHLDHIIWLETQGNYTIIFTHNNIRHTVKKSLIRLTEELDDRFIRIQRAVYVNSDFINRVDFNSNKININTYSLKISRAFRKNIVERMNEKYNN